MQIDTTATEESPVSNQQEGKILRRPIFSETTNHQYCRPPQNDSCTGIVILSEAKNLGFQVGTEDPF